MVPACDISVTGALTTTTPVAAYRGAGRPEATFVIERLMDEAARGLGLDPAEIRRRNFIAAGAFPYRTATGQVYDSGDYHLALDRALEAADYAGLRREQAERRKRGEIVGIGLASYVEPCALGWESGSLKVERSGRVTAITGSSAHGQGHETTFAQIVADHLGVTPDEVEVRARRHALRARRASAPSAAAAWPSAAARWPACRWSCATRAGASRPSCSRPRRPTSSASPAAFTWRDCPSGA